MGRRATGPFDVKINAQPTYNTDPAALLARMSIDKQFRGDLEGLAGSISIEIVGGKHSYIFDYELPRAG
jgi:hypothetical protein